MVVRVGYGRGGVRDAVSDLRRSSVIYRKGAKDAKEAIVTFASSASFAVKTN